MATLSVLGPLMLAVGGDEVVLRPAQRRILALLATAPRDGLTKDALIARMWPDSAPSGAKASMQVHISGIRSKAPGIIKTTEFGYRLAADELDLDVAMLESLHKTAVQAASDETWTELIDLTDSAQALWRGTAFPEIDDDTWVAAEIFRLDEIRLGLREMGIEARLALGRPQEVVPDLYALVAQHPLRERFTYQLMVALYQGGRQAEALRAFQLLRKTLGDEVGLEPNPSLRELEEQILLHDPGLGDPHRIATPHNLPVVVTSFVDDGSTVDNITKLFEESRLVTITGGAGFGKTRLAIELGRTLLDSHPGGVWFAALVDAHTTEDVMAVIASATGDSHDISNLADLATHLTTRPMVLILDNAEHVVHDCAEFVTAALATNGELKLITTSRVSLGVEGERTWRLDPLGLPTHENADGAQTISLRSPAIRLFMDRAQAVDRSFNLTESSAPQILDLSLKLAGIPLAIELAARWVSSLDIGEISSMLSTADGDLSIQTAVTPGDLLRATIERSLALLGETDRNLARRMAVFSGTFDLTNALEVCNSDLTRSRFAAATARLVDASLVRANRGSDGMYRYSMLAPIREALRYRDHSASAEIAERHARHYLALARTHHRDLFRTAIDLGSTDHDVDNIRTALDFGFEHGWSDDVAEACAALSPYLHQRYLHWESQTWLERCLTLDLEASTRARVLRPLGSGAQILGHLGKAEDAFEAAIALLDNEGDTAGRARCLMSLSGVQSDQGEWDSGFETAKQALDLVEPEANQSAIAVARYYMGENTFRGGDFDGAIPHLRHAVESFAQTGEKDREAYVYSRIARTALLAGDEATARDALGSALQLISDSESDYVIVQARATSALYEAIWGDVRSGMGDLLEVNERIHGEHPDRIFDVLIPAIALFLRIGEWDRVVLTIEGVKRVIDDTEIALPVPWSDTLGAWEDEAFSHIGYARSAGQTTTVSAGELTRSTIDAIYESLSASAQATPVSLDSERHESRLWSDRTKLALGNKRP